MSLLLHRFTYAKVVGDDIETLVLLLENEFAKFFGYVTRFSAENELFASAVLSDLTERKNFVYKTGHAA